MGASPDIRGERTLSERSIRNWTPNNDLTQSRSRASFVTEVPGRQWDVLKSLWYGGQITIIWPLAMPSFPAPVPRAGPAGASP